MDPLLAAFIAAIVAWLSIIIVVHLPGSRLPAAPVRTLGGIAIALFGLIVLGVSLPSLVPLAFLGGGVLGVYLTRPQPLATGQAHAIVPDNQSLLKLGLPLPTPQDRSRGATDADNEDDQDADDDRRTPWP